jgi:hypothetical protein
MHYHLVAIISFLLLSPVLFALDTVFISQGQIKWRKNKGELKSQSFSFEKAPLKIISQSESLLLDSDGDKLTFQLSQTKLLWNFKKDSLINNLSFIDISNLNFSYSKKEKVHLKWDSAAFEICKGPQAFGSLELKCRKLKNKKGASLSIFTPCLQLGQLKIPVLRFNNLSQKTVSKALASPAGIKKIEDITLSIMNHQFGLQFKAKYLFKLKVKCKGQVQFDQKSSRLIIHLQKAKIGWFSVKSRLLKEIKKSGIKNVKVKGTSIIIQI